MTTPQGDSGSSGLRALGIGCVIVLVLATIGTAVGAWLLLGRWKSIPQMDSKAADAAPAWAPPPDLAAWPDDAGVVVDVTGTSLTGTHVPPPGVYVVGPDTGSYARWSGPSAACAGTSQCGSWAGAHDQLFAAERSGRLLAFDPQGTATPIDLEGLQAPTADANVPIAASWDGQTLAYSTFGDGRETVVVLDLAHRKVQQSKLDRMATSRCMALSPDGTKLVYATASGLGFAPTGKARAPAAIAGPWRGAVRTLAWAPDGAHLLVVADASTPQNAKDLWIIDAKTQASHRIAVPQPRPDIAGDLYQRVVSASFAPDGKHLQVLSDVDAMCVHPRAPTPCVCDAALYEVGVDGTSWHRTGGTFQACGDVFWIR
jgi:hypothetical protein